MANKMATTLEHLRPSGRMIIPEYSFRYDSVPSNENEELHLMEQIFWRDFKTLGFKVFSSPSLWIPITFKAGAFHPNDAEGSSMALSVDYTMSRSWDHAMRWCPNVNGRKTAHLRSTAQSSIVLNLKLSRNWVESCSLRRQPLKLAGGRLSKRGARSVIRWMLEWY
jgi:hypothetical protein